MTSTCDANVDGRPARDLSANYLSRPKMINAGLLVGCESKIGNGTFENLVVTGNLIAPNFLPPTPPTPPTAIRNILTVTIDGPTIQSCIDLCVNPNAFNTWVVRIPPGVYPENLILRGSVSLQGMGNPRDSLAVNVQGHHILVGAGPSSLDNRVTMANIAFSDLSPVIPLFDFSTTSNLQRMEVTVSNCFISNYNAALTTRIFLVNPNVTLYVFNIQSRMLATAGQGGTHFTINGAGNIFMDFGVDIAAGTRAIDMSATVNNAFVFIDSSRITVSGPEIIRMSAVTAPFFCNVTSVGNIYQNTFLGGNGVDLQVPNASMNSTTDYWDILDDPTSYVVNGVALSFFAQLNNTYANIPFVQIRNIKLKNLVSLSNFTSALVPSP